MRAPMMIDLTAGCASSHARASVAGAMPRSSAAAAKRSSEAKVLSSSRCSYPSGLVASREPGGGSSFWTAVLVQRAQLRGVEVAHAPRLDQADLQKPLERAGRLLERRVRIEIVCEIEVHRVDSEAVEARLELARHPGARHPVVGARLHRIERLGDDHGPIAAACDPVPDPLLASSAAVRVGGVERADAERPRGVHQLQRLLLALALAEERRRGADTPEVAAAENEPGVHRPILAQARCEPCSRRVPSPRRWPRLRRIGHGTRWTSS
ncbi:MAG: hypothetical protein AUG91_00315 [Actinobacteria bacterium 13_1_20CM_4_69_9]|nr:MAG: hypothetical protein AUG91_00315 [Actinobacteria bacterium 13_1_20CM_4_69_9]